MKTILLSITVLLGGSLFTQAAYVEDVRAEFSAPGKFDSTRPFGQSIVSMQRGSQVSVFSGQFRLSYAGGSTTAYCMEITYLLGTPKTYDFYVDPLSQHTDQLSPETLQQADYLYATHGGSVNSDAQAAALQAAIWNLLYPSDFDVASTDPVYGQYSSYLAAAKAASGYSGSAWWQTYDEMGNHLQGVVGSPVPESKYFGLGSVLVLAGLISWELRRGRFMPAAR